MLTLPIYLRGTTYYLHTRVGGKQLKRSLQTSDRKTAIIRALRLLEFILSKSVNPEEFDLSKVRQYEIDLEKGTFRADGAEDHQMMMEALKSIAVIKQSQSIQAQPITEQVPKSKKTGLTLPQLLEKLFLVKSKLSPATLLAYRKTIDEFSEFAHNPILADIGKIDITNYQEFLAKKNNSTRTIDNKIANLCSIFNFAIKQGYMFGDNPAQGRKLQSNKDRAKSGYAIFTKAEIKQIFASEFLTQAKVKDPDYYWSVVLGLVTGCRISEVTSLTKGQFKVSEGGTHYIDIVDSKTPAGVRPVPITERLLKSGLAEFMADKTDKEKIFRYNLRLGKGSGNAVGKKIKRNLEAAKVDRPKLVYHSFRKFCNNHLKENGVSYEARCQFIGHEIDDINNTVYSQNFTLDKLGELTNNAILSLEMMAGIVQTKF